MKAILLFLTLCASTLAENVNVTLAWDANPEPDMSEYRLYVGTAHEIYAQPIVVKATQQTVSLPAGTLHYAIVTAVNTSGMESLPSAELVFQVYREGEGKAPSAPVNMRKVAGLTVEVSNDLRVWAVLHSQLLEATEPNQFFRLVLTP